MARMRWVIAMVMGLLLITFAGVSFAQTNTNPEGRAGVGDPVRLPASTMLPQKTKERHANLESPIPQVMNVKSRYLVSQQVMEMMKVGISGRGLGWSVEW